MHKSLFLLLSICCWSMFAFAQTSSPATATSDIKGFVYDKNTGEPIIYTNVYLLGTTYGATTDINGFYSIKKVPVGSYTIMSTYVGYDSSVIKIDLVPNQIFTQKLYLSKKARRIKELVVKANKDDKVTEVQISEIKATPVQIKQLPSIGGEPDLAQYLQVVPGIVSSGDQGGQLFIRGGAPVQNKIMLDGMTIYNPFHSLGLFSVFETDIIKNADIKTAGFNVNYGGATSAIVDVTTRDGNKKRMSGKVSANTFTSKVLLEGPLRKLKEGSGSSSFLVSAKSSYLNKSSKLFYGYADTNGLGLPYSFTDLYAKLSFNSNSGSKFNIFGFDFMDHANYQGVADYKWSSAGGGANFVINPVSSTVLIKGNLSYSNYTLELKEADNKPRTTSIGGFGANIDFGYILPKNATMNYGLEVNGFKTTYHFYNPLGIQVGNGEDQNTTELAAFIMYKKILNSKLIIEPGLRIPYYASLDEFSVEPRLGVKYNYKPNLRFKGAAGMYSQNLISTKSDRDIVNLFTGFLSGPEEELKTTEGAIATSKLQKSMQLVGGFEYDLKKLVEFNVEAYVKDFTQLVNINRDKLQVQDPNFMIESGYAYGGDISAKIEYRRIYLWLVYGLGFVNRYDGTKNADGSKFYYAPPFDRRNNINVLFTYMMGKDQTWELGARWNFGSGFPFTLTQGFYEKFDFSNGINANYINSNGQLGILYDKRINVGRLPYYHRLDMSLKKKMYVGKNGLFEGVLSVTNVYNRANIFYFDRIRNTRVNQLPVLPALGISYSF